MIVTLPQENLSRKALSICPKMEINKHNRFIPEVHRVGFAVYFDSLWEMMI